MIGPVIVGDSLAVGMRPFMPETSIDAAVGRPLAVGMARLPSAAAAPRLGISLGTNDPPTATRQLAAAVTASMRGRERVVWATIYRAGLDYRAMNRVLIRAHARHPRRVRLVGWATIAARYVSADGVHPGPAGYRRRAALYRMALRP